MKLSPAPSVVFTRPTQFGPTIRTPVSRPRSMIRCCAALFSSVPVSAKPEAKTMTPPTLHFAHSRMTSSTKGAARAIITQSGGVGSSDMEGKQRKPAASVYFGLTPNTLPENPRMFDRVRSPKEPGVEDAPTTATTSGAIRRRRSS